MLPAASMDRRPSLYAALLGLGLAACGTGSRRSPEPEDEAHRRPAPPALPAAEVIDADAPLDMRALRIRPEHHVGKERVCDVWMAGQSQPVGTRVATRYPMRVAVRRLVRCGAVTGEGWADLVFAPASASLVGSVVSGKRLRVAVVAASGGFEDAPILEFLAVIGDMPGVPAADEDFQSLRAGFDFGAVAGQPELVGTDATCAIAYASPPEPIPEDRLDRYPGGATHRLGLVCAHAAGDAWVDLVFTAERVEEVLALRRGARARIRVLSAEGGAADLPIVALSPASGAGDS